jgi:hypothetical protein
MSHAMKLLQSKCGVSADGDFGPNTAKAIAAHYELSPERAAHLLGQASHESGGFKVTRENLNYSAERCVRFGLIDLNHLRCRCTICTQSKSTGRKNIFRSHGE